jgi:hypothetical protein
VSRWIRGPLLAAAFAVALPGVAVAAPGPPREPVPAPSGVPVANLPKLTGDGTSCTPASTVVADAAPWAQGFLRPDAAWTLSTGAGATVAVLDAGVDAVHVGQLAGRVDPPVDILHPNAPVADDCTGHGTFLAGLVAAATVDTSPFAGVAPAARILPVRVVDDQGNTTAAILAAGIKAAADHGARVVLVAPGVRAADPGLRDAVRYALAHGALVVAPATLDQQSQPAITFPAGFAETLAVGGIDSDGSPSPPGSSGAHVDLAAPADQVVSVGPGGGGNFVYSGPSCAAAFVAGVAALVLAYRPESTPADVTARLESTAYHVGDTQPDPLFGYGTVDPVGAVSGLMASSTGPGTSARATVSMPAPATHPGRDAALAIAGSLVAALLVVAAGFAVVPGGNRRRWRAGPS